MKSLVARQHAAEPTLIVSPDLQRPLAAGEVLIDVLASAVNPIDLFVASGTAHPVFGLPEQVGLGWDVVGRVKSVAAGVDSFTPGDLVAGLHDDLAAPSGAHADQVVLPATALALVPAGLTPVGAATVPLNTLTADQALRPLGEPAGRTLLVTGAAGAVGGYAVALAASAGWEVTGLARAADEEWVRGAGATHFVTSLEPAAYDVVFDTAVLGSVAVAATRDGGDYVGVMPPAVPDSERGVRTGAVSVQADGSRLSELLARSVSGELEIRVAGTGSLEEAAAVYAKVGGGGQRGRWVLEV
ncbi:alcohol dehydrogenase catalytic domain-containing protein [Nocardioides sp.]|uniref:alcohol dehydrogenase catalytic domain-containing protein n=1 Tax=Nocardioides sp. TaxID=35761 RepID=UPI002BA6D995|nr:zinc-binding dehydrogenase [Nocardioides sp.]HXH79250.1 zinc-binding dehydrogenase [Nocardioides sp.]